MSDAIGDETMNIQGTSKNKLFRLSAAGNQLVYVVADKIETAISMYNKLVGVEPTEVEGLTSNVYEAALLVQAEQDS